MLVRALGWAGALQGKLTGCAPFITPELANLSLLTFSCDCTKATRELGFRIVPLRNMVASCAEWLMAENLLPGGKVEWRDNRYRQARRERR